MSLINAILQRRSGNVAVYNGNEVTCGQCGNNKEFKALPLMPPTHKCIMLLDGNTFRVIYDPYNILDECPLKKQ